MHYRFRNPDIIFQEIQALLIRRWEEEQDTFKPIIDRKSCYFLVKDESSYRFFKDLFKNFGVEIRLAKYDSTYKIPLIELKADSESIAMFNADAVFEKTQQNVMVTHTSLFSRTMPGFPGAFVDCFELEMIQKTLERLNDLDITMRKTIVIKTKSENFVWNVILQGKLMPPRGTNGTLIDKMFYSNIHKFTLGEMDNMTIIGMPEFVNLADSIKNIVNCL